MKFKTLFFFLLFPFVVVAQKNIKILATNSWTAAYAQAAGVENIRQLASSSLIHPSEYELQIADLEKITSADLIIYAGYEVVMSQIRQSLKINENKFLKIETGYSEKQIIEPIKKIAAVSGTETKAALEIKKMEEMYEDARKNVEKAGMKGKPVIVHYFHQGLAADLGLNIIAVIGPAPIEIFNLRDLAKNEAVLIIDNAHNPIAKPLAKIKNGIRCVEWLNFPGTQHTETLEDVFKYNLNLLLNI